MTGTLTLTPAGSDPQHVSSDADLTIEADRAGTGDGDLVFKTGGTERLRISSNGTVTGFVATAHELSSPTYGKATSFGNVPGSFTFAGTGTPADIYAPIVIYQRYGFDTPNANVLKTTQAFYSSAAYYGPATDDGMECGSTFVAAKDTGTPYTQTLPITAFEGHAQVEGANHATGHVIGIAGRFSAKNTSTIDTAYGVYSSGDKDVGATITTYYAFYQASGGLGTTSYLLYGVDDILTAGNLQVGGFQGNNSLFADVAMAAAMGFKTWNIDPSVTTTGTAPTAGTVYAVAVPYRKGQIISKTIWFTATAGAGTAPTHIYTGICDSTGKMVAQSIDDVANSGWTGASHLVNSPLSANYTIPTSGLYYHVFLQVGAWGTTQMTLNRTTGGPTAINGSLMQATGSTVTQTALPANNSNIAGGLVATNSLRYFSGS